MSDSFSPPHIFKVGVTTSKASGGGRLQVEQHSVVCELGPVNRKVSGLSTVKQYGARIDIYVAKLVPPWFNVSVPISDGENLVRASMWLPGLRKLREALSSAGFQVSVHRTWLERGPSPYTDFATDAD